MRVGASVAARTPVELNIRLAAVSARPKAVAITAAIRLAGNDHSENVACALMSASDLVQVFRQPAPRNALEPRLPPRRAPAKAALSDFDRSEQLAFFADFNGQC